MDLEILLQRLGALPQTTDWNTAAQLYVDLAHPMRVDVLLLAGKQTLLAQGSQLLFDCGVKSVLGTEWLTLAERTGDFWDDLGGGDSREFSLNWCAGGFLVLELLDPGKGLGQPLVFELDLVHELLLPQSEHSLRLFEGCLGCGELCG